MLLDRLSEFLSRYKGLPTMLAIVLVVVDFVLQFVHLGWLSTTHVFLHLGIIVGFLGLLLARAIG